MNGPIRAALFDSASCQFLVFLRLGAGLSFFFSQNISRRKWRSRALWCYSKELDWRHKNELNVEKSLSTDQAKTKKRKTKQTLIGAITVFNALQPTCWVCHAPETRLEAARSPETYILKAHRSLTYATSKDEWDISQVSSVPAAAAGDDVREISRAFRFHGWWWRGGCVDILTAQARSGECEGLVWCGFCDDVFGVYAYYTDIVCMCRKYSSTSESIRGERRWGM